MSVRNPAILKGQNLLRLPLMMILDGFSVFRARTREARGNRNREYKGQRDTPNPLVRTNQLFTKSFIALRLKTSFSDDALNRGRI